MMKHWNARKYPLYLLLALMFAAICAVTPTRVHAAMADEAVDYVWGKTESDTFNGKLYYKFSLSGQKHVEFRFTNNAGNFNHYFNSNSGYGLPYVTINVYNASGTKVVTDGAINLGYTTNSATGFHTTRFSKDLNAGLYYVEIYMHLDRTFSLDITTEDLKSMPQGALSSAASPSSGKLQLTATAAPNAMGYTFEYATNYSFSDAVTVNTDQDTLSVSGLEDGTVYYAHVRPYTLYNDGVEVYGQYSPISKVTIGAASGSSDIQLSAGQSFTQDGAIYVLLSNGTLDYITPVKSTVTSAVVPATVIYGGRTYKVSTIHNYAFAGYKKLKKVSIGKNVKSIGVMAFYGCKKLKTITITSALLKQAKIGSNAFKGIPATAKIKVPASKVKTYRTMFTKRGLSKKATVK